jgi:hypothetical protein
VGLSVVLETEDGEAIESVDDPTNILHRLLPRHDDESYSLLRFIDWDGDTVFNRMQIPTFIVEWQRIKPRAGDERDLSLLAQVEKLAERCLEEPHQYLKFYGD